MYNVLIYIHKYHIFITIKKLKVKITKYLSFSFIYDNFQLDNDAQQIDARQLFYLDHHVWPWLAGASKYPVAQTYMLASISKTFSWL